MLCIRVLTIENAVSKMTDLPAERFGLTDRGRIKNGDVADLVIFDPGTVGNRSTFDSPYELADGIKEVFVAGETVSETAARYQRSPAKYCLAESTASLPLERNPIFENCGEEHD
jgi:N-acyl-D-amino-acid deacylase